MGLLGMLGFLAITLLQARMGFWPALLLVALVATLIDWGCIRLRDASQPAREARRPPWRLVLPFWWSVVWRSILYAAIAGGLLGWLAASLIEADVLVLVTGLVIASALALKQGMKARGWARPGRGALGVWWSLFWRWMACSVAIGMLGGLAEKALAESIETAGAAPILHVALNVVIWIPVTMLALREAMTVHAMAASAADPVL
jgi:hypothetical protein